MHVNFNNDRVLAVVAHPDDVELLCAGTLARAKADGAVIGICVLCRGDKGQCNPPVENLAEIRSGEMRAAAELLGAELYEGGFGDGELFDGYEQRRVLIEIFRKFRPTLVLAHAQNDYHPDHQQASVLADAASWFCASAGHQTDSSPMDSPPSLWWMDTISMAGFEPGFYIDISPYLDLKQKMLRCHKSQLARGGNTDFSPLEETMRNQAAVRGTLAGVKAAEAFQIHSTWKRATAW